MLTGVSTRKRIVLLVGMHDSVVLGTTKFTLEDGIHTLDSGRRHQHRLQDIVDAGKNNIQDIVNARNGDPN